MARAVLDDLVARYGEPHRRYHTLRHVEAVLDAIDDLIDAEPVDDPAAVRFAGWLHDVVYDPTQPGNEARSASFARRSLSMLHVPVETIDETARLIDLTAGHEVAWADGNGRVLIDADLAILGADADVYDRYAADVRAEYAHMPDDAFVSGRRAILEAFAVRPRIFLTDAAHERFEDAARANLAREVSALGG